MRPSPPVGGGRAGALRRAAARREAVGDLDAAAVLRSWLREEQQGDGLAPVDAEAQAIERWLRSPTHPRPA